MEIKDYAPKFKEQIADLQTAQWGDGSDSDEVTDNLNKYEIKIIADGDNLFGAAVWHIENEETCFVDFIILKPQIQHKGWGRKLMDKVLEFAANHNCKFVECEAISVYGKVNAKNLLESMGFEKQFEKKNYWGKKIPTFHCKECGQKPCVCSMLKYKKEIKGS